MSKDNTSSEDGFTLNEWVDAPLVEYDHTERAKAELGPLLRQLIDKADEIGVPVFVALQLSQGIDGVGHKTTSSWREAGQLSGGMLALEDALSLNAQAVFRARAAQISRLEKLGIIPGSETAIH